MSEFYDRPLPADDPSQPDPDVLVASEGSTPTPWQINDAGAAEWALRHVAESRDAIANADVQAGAWRERIEAWRESETDKARRRLAFFEDRLADYLRRCRDADPKVKSINLPSGAVQSRSRGPAIKVADVDAFLAWACTSELAHKIVRIKQEPDLPALREALNLVDKDGELVVVDSDSGELVPGLRVDPASVSYSVAT